MCIRDRVSFNLYNFWTSWPIFKQFFLFESIFAGHFSKLQDMRNKLKLLVFTGQFRESRDRRRHLRLTLYYRIIEGLIPALPPEKFLQQQKPGRQIHMRQLGGKSCNPVNNNARHNDRPYFVTHCTHRSGSEKLIPPMNSCKLEQAEKQCGAHK